MQRWEYRQLTVGTQAGHWAAANLALSDERLRALGAEGWELVAAFPLVYGGDAQATVYVFKRPAPR